MGKEKAFYKDTAIFMEEESDEESSKCSTAASKNVPDHQQFEKQIARFYKEIAEVCQDQELSSDCEFS